MYTNEKDEKSLSNNKVLSVFEDSRRNVWLTTQGRGICLFHPETENFTRYDTGNGLPNDVVYQIAEDEDGVFWLTTNNGLARFDLTSGAVKVYTTANGLPSDQFNYRSSFKDKDGTIYFGSIDGFVAFNPKTFSENKYVPSAVITDFLLFNKRCGLVLRIRRYRKILLSRISCYSVRSKILFLSGLLLWGIRLRR